MRRIFRMIVGILAGAGVMYLFDPRGGNRRRALLRDKAVKLTNTAGDTLDDTVHDAKNRAQGVVAETKRHFRDEEISDQQLVARVRSEIGPVVSNVGEIDVAASSGEITISGPVMEHEKSDLLHAIKSVHGVKEVHDRLEVYQV